MKISYSYIIYKCIFQRVGCVHGEELGFVLGYPLLGDYYANYSRSEQNLAELVMTYWTNFIISG